MNGGLRWFGTTWRWVIIDRIFIFWVNYPFNILWIEKLLVCKKQIRHWISPNLFETHLSWMAWDWTNIFLLLLIMFKTNGFGLFAWDQCHFLVKNSLVGNFYLFICLFIYWHYFTLFHFVLWKKIPPRSFRKYTIYVVWQGFVNDSFDFFLILAL